MKKKLFLIPLFATSLLFVSCNGASRLPFAPGTQPAENLYAFQAATSIGLLSNNDTAIRSAISNDESTALVSEMEKYLPSVEAALAGMDELTSAKKETSDREEFANKLTISYKDIALANNEFTMYFNETLIQDEEADADAEAEEEKDEEQESEIAGIIVIGEKEYAMSGKKELDSVENEYEVSFTYTLDDNTTVKVEQEIENDETEFEYKIEKDGHTIYEYSIEIENNNEVELEVKEKGIGKTKYEFELVSKDGKQLIKAEYKKGKDHFEVLFEKVISEIDQSVSYVVVE